MTSTDHAELVGRLRSRTICIWEGWTGGMGTMTSKPDPLCRQAADAIAKLVEERDSARNVLANIDERLGWIISNDLTSYKHHQARRDGKKPREVSGGDIFCTPHEMASAARTRIAEFFARAAQGEGRGA